MSRYSSNAFHLDAPDPGRNPLSSLASSLAALQAGLEPAPHGVTLTLSPMRAADVFSVLAEAHPDAWVFVSLGKGASSADHRLPTSLLSDEPAAWPDAGVFETFESGSLAMSVTAATELLKVLPASDVDLVLVDGPIESGDAKAMSQAIDAGEPALAAEFRAIASFSVKDGRNVVLHARDADDARRVVAENLRLYLAAVLNQQVGGIDVPPAWQIERLFSMTGMLAIRPIETDVYSTFVDIGISTSADGLPRPADQSLVYDVPSNSWHDEP